MSVSIIAQLKAKENNPDTSMIVIRGYINSKPVASRSLGFKIKTVHWDHNKHQVISTAPNASLINSKIAMELQAIDAALLKKEIMGCSINRLHVKQVVAGDKNSTDFYEYCNEKIATYKAKETRKTYFSEITKLQKFQDILSFNDIDYSFLTKYKNYMAGELANEPNTIWKAFKFMNTMINDAIKVGGIISKNPFDTFNRGQYYQPKRQWLTLQHCDAIEELTACADDTIKKVAIYFLLMAYSGMRFGDAMKFNASVHVIDDERIIMTYDKMQTDVNNKMHTRLKRIVDLTRENKLQITNQKFNQWLKLIAIKCGITLNLTSHVGRHTMGSLLAEMNISEENAKVILGHRSIKSTRIYYHQQTKTIDTALDKLNSM